MESAFKYAGERKSHRTFNEVYFWTSAIKDWKHLLKTDDMKMIIIGSFNGWCNMDWFIFMDML